MRRTPGLVLSCASKSKPQPTINSAPLSQNMTVKVPMHATRPSSQPNRSHAQSSKSVTDRRWFERVHWENTFWVIVFPLFGLAAAMFTPLRTNTAILMFFYHFTTGLGITAGYHRLWAHRSYTAGLPLRIWLAAVGAGAMEHSIMNWSRDHRAHHRYTDTAKDPYSVHTGFFHAHIGWLILKPDPKDLGDADISDLMKDPVVVWQHQHYAETAMMMAYILPCCIGGLWGDWWGGFVYAGIIRAFLVQQSTFCVNSVAHWFGDHTYDDRNSPRDHVLTALITLGEGYHNFHHEFPSDYRNAIAWHQFDPTKWMIWLWKQVGLAHNLKVFRLNEIEKGRLQQQQKKLDRTVAELQSTKLDQLPVMAWRQFQDEVSKGRAWLTISGVVHDVGEFVDEHPGGEMMIKSSIGKDVTAMFNGGVHTHSRAAHQRLATMNVGIIRGGGEVEILNDQGRLEVSRDQMNSH